LVLAEYVGGQVGGAVGGEAGPVAEHRVANLALPPGAIDAVIRLTAAVIIGIHLTGGDYGDVLEACPGHHSADVGQDVAVIPDACVSLGEEIVVLRAHVYENVSTSGLYELTYHFTTPQLLGLTLLMYTARRKTSSPSSIVKLWW